MKTVRPIATVLYYLSRTLAVLVLAICAYAAVVLLLFHYGSGQNLPMETSGDHFTIFFPFTRSPFLLGNYTLSYLVTNLLTFAFYGLFLWLLGGVFYAFRQQKLFTPKGVVRLSRFYMINLVVPVLFLLVLIFSKEETSDFIRIMMLHLVIGVFAFFMAAIFRQGLELQNEQDLTF
jgi:hypothetical protein